MKGLHLLGGRTPDHTELGVHGGKDKGPWVGSNIHLHFS